MTPRVASLALRLLRRAHRAGELRVLLASIAVAVASVTAVGFFTDRVNRVLETQGAELLGADLVLRSDDPIPPDWATEARQWGLTTAETWTFVSMVMGPEGGRLATIKAVSPGYPLRGRLETDPPVEAGTIPVPGSVWLEPRLARGLGAVVTVGDKAFNATRKLMREPDRAGDFFNIAPRLLMNLADIPATGLVQDYSRVRYRLLVAGESARLEEFTNSIEPRLGPGQTLQRVEDARPEVRSALDRARSFLGLASLVAVLLAAVAVALAARRYARRHLDDSAIMRCLGASQGVIVRIVVLQMLVLGVIGTLLGVLAGLAAHGVLVHLLAEVLSVELPLPSLRPVLAGLVVGLLTLAAFALPPVLRLKDTPALRVLRNDLGGGSPAWRGYLWGVGLIAGFMLWQAGDRVLGMYVVGGAGVLILLLGIGARLLLWVLGGLRGRVGVSWRFGLANLNRRPMASVVQVVGFGLGVMALLLLTLVRGQLFGEWQARLPPDAPNRFIIDIQPDQVAPVRRFLVRNGLTTPQLYPMVRGRLLEINGRRVRPESWPKGRARRLVAREFNLSWSADPIPYNSITSGQWWTSPRAVGQWSVEKGIAAALGIHLGDRLVFRVGGRRVEGGVSNLRRVAWDSFKVNFFVIATPPMLRDSPTSYITSFYLPPRREALLDDLVQEFPNLSVIDVAAIMDRVRGIMDRVAMALEYVFLFTVLAGVLVMGAAIQSTRDERVRETALLRTLGASRRQLRAGLLAEFGALGLVAGLMGSLGADVVARLLAGQVLHLPYEVDPWLWSIGPLGGTLLVMGAGWAGLRGVLDQAPVVVLRTG